MSFITEDEKAMLLKEAIAIYGNTPNAQEVYKLKLKNYEAQKKRQAELQVCIDRKSKSVQQLTNEYMAERGLLKESKWYEPLVNCYEGKKIKELPLYEQNKIYQELGRDCYMKLCQQNVVINESVLSNTNKTTTEEGE